MGKVATELTDFSFLNAIAERLQTDGIATFGEVDSKVMTTLERRRDAMTPERHFSSA